MFGEITLLMVLQGTALIAAGAAAGYFLALNNFDKQRDKLNDELENARAEIKEHREKVDNHFLKTALLFNRLTDNYREIYEHLATGAQTLCSPQTSTPQLDQPETRVLPAIEGSAAETESEGDSELAATHSPHPDTLATTPAKAESGEKPMTGAAAEVPTPEEATQEKSEAETPRPDTAEVPTADKSASDDTHIGADATPAPTGAGEEKPAAEASTSTESGEERPAPEAPSTPKTGADIDRYKSPPSIH